MGYTTEFTGSVDVTPPLNPYEINYLTRFAQSRRRQRDRGPYVAEPGNDYGQGDAPDIRDHNQPPDGQPGLWCQWVPTADGAAIEWDGVEKFYRSAEWMRYLINVFLRPSAELQRELTNPIPGRDYDPTFQHFTFNHVVSGEIAAQGEDSADAWTLVVRANVVETVSRSARKTP